MIPSKYRTVLDAAGYLSVHPSTVYLLLRSGKLTGVKVHNAWRISRDELDKYFQEAAGLNPPQKQ